MATIYDVRTPEEALMMAGHYIEGFCLTFRTAAKPIKVIRHAQLIGSLYILVRQMRKHWHNWCASRIEEMMCLIADLNIDSVDSLQEILREYENLGPLK